MLWRRTERSRRKTCPQTGQRLHPAPSGPHRSREVTVVGEQKMMLRSALSLTVLGILCGAAQAQPYPPSYYPPAGMQAYPPARPPAPTMADDDDDDLPPHLRA